MKIYFCDGCNESVPLADVQSGRMTTIKGKLFCSNCIPPSTVSPAPLSQPSRARSNPLWAVLIIVLVGWTIWRDWPIIANTAPLTEEVQPRDPLGDMARSIEAIDVRLMQSVADGGQSGRELLSLRADLEMLRAADAEQLRAASRLEDDVDRLAHTQAEMGRLIEKVQMTVNLTEVLNERVDALSDSVAAHQAMLSMVRVPSGDGVMPLELEQAPQQLVDPAREALVSEVRRLLLDPEPDMRFEAVYRVEEDNVVELVPELIAMLEDEDMFVCLQAMRVLGDFDAEEAVPALFDVLEGTIEPIRNEAAGTLVRLTGYDPGFEAKASLSERSKAITRWREWYATR
jgi:hypothetical protein